MTKPQKPSKDEKDKLEQPLEEMEIEAEANKEEAVPSPGEAQAETEQPAEEGLEGQVERLQAEAKEYLDGWQRARAEFANYKKRIEREREEARARIAGEIITRYLGVMDDLERALAKAPEDEACAEWVAGIELIHAKLKAILEAEGVETIEAEGERFDPNYHEAISYEESDEFEGGSVIEVTQKGYKLGDRILRPAMVRVAK